MIEPNKMLTVDYLWNISQDHVNYIAARNYKEGATLEQFYEDLGRISYIQKMLSRKANSGTLNIRLLLNHMITMGNIFGPKVTKLLLFKKLHHQYWPQIKTVLCFLAYMEFEEMPEVEIDPKLYHSLGQV